MALRTSAVSALTVYANNTLAYASTNVCPIGYLVAHEVESQKWNEIASNPRSIIDDTIPGNRLYVGTNGSIGLKGKPIGYVLGEQLVRVCDAISTLFSRISLIVQQFERRIVRWHSGLDSQIAKASLQGGKLSSKVFEEVLGSEYSSSWSEQRVVRAAFELGSGGFKLCVAEVSPRATRVLFQNLTMVHLGADYTENKGVLSPIIQEKALSVLREFRTVAQKYRATEFSGIATAVFRHATNGAEVFERLKQQSFVPLQIISQEDEGALGFLTGVVTFPEIPKEELLLLDIGSLSVQITGNLETKERYGAELGLNRLTRLFAERIRKETYSQGAIYANITFEELSQLVDIAQEEAPTCEWIQERVKLKRAKLANFDRTVPKNEVVSLRRLEGSMRKLINPRVELKGVSEEARQTRMFCDTLRYAFMKKMGFDRLHLGVNPVGNSLGLLISKKYWPQRDSSS